MEDVTEIAHEEMPVKTFDKDKTFENDIDAIEMAQKSNSQTGDEYEPHKPNNQATIERRKQLNRKVNWILDDVSDNPKIGALDHFGREFMNFSLATE